MAAAEVVTFRRFLIYKRDGSRITEQRGRVIFGRGSMNTKLTKSSQLLSTAVDVVWFVVLVDH